MGKSQTRKTGLIIILFFIYSIGFSQNHAPVIQNQTEIDIEGHTFPYVIVGGKRWMSENLQVTHYNDGTSAKFTIGPYGNYYDWYTVNTGKLCPTGWSIPTLTDWQNLAMALGGVSVAGNKLKAKSALWDIPNTNHTDEVGFSALPMGYAYIYHGDNGNWWASTQYPDDANCAYTGRLYAMGVKLQLPFLMKSYEISVRCVK